MALSNNDVKYFASLKQKKIRESENKFLVEGFHLIEECLNSSYVIETIVLKNGVGLEKHKEIKNKASEINVRIESVPEKLFVKLSETENTQGIVGIVRMPEAKKDNSTPGNEVIALDRINDPGNLGTIIRTAYWFGIDSVLISKNSADIYNSKTLRASQGAVFHMNIISGLDLKKNLHRLNSNGYKIYLFDASAQNDLGRTEMSGKNIFVFGNEAEGISPVISEGPYERLKINGFSGCESLNVAVSAGILMYHLKNGMKIV